MAMRAVPARKVSSGGQFKRHVLPSGVECRYYGESGNPTRNRPDPGSAISIYDVIAFCSNLYAVTDVYPTKNVLLEVKY